MEAPLNKSVIAGKQYKYTNSEAEITAVKNYLMDHVATATMIADALNIYRPNLCRHKRELQKQGILKELFKGHCKVTGWRATYLTCKLDAKEGGNNV